MIYAPIIIPTLNRIEHLKRCIESLQNNLWAKYTSLIISVDYPPEEKYFEGYKKILEYLKGEISGFYNVEIICQETNLGAYQNELFLIRYVEKRYDRYIFTEDDNDFSPNFIEYIDKGLEIFKNDDEIMAICSNGTSMPEDENNNIVLSQNFTAYGYGTWISKEKEIREKLNRNFLARGANNISFLLELARKQVGLLFSLQSAAFRKEKLYQLPGEEVPYIDQMIKVYLIAEHKFVVGSCIKKGRTWGMDGSGVNCPRNDNYNALNLEIDIEQHFDYKYCIPMKQHKMQTDFSIEVICRIISAIIKLRIWGMKVNRIGEKCDFKENYFDL